MAFDFNALIRRLGSQNTGPAAGTGLTGLGATTGGALSPSGGGLNPSYNPVTNIQPLPSFDPADYKSVDDMTFDANYQTNWDALQRRLADAQSNYDLANQQDDEDYQRATREAGEQRDIDAQALLDRLANQGILRSGIQVKASGDLENSFQNRMNEFNRQRTQAKNERERTFTGMKQGVQDQIALLQSEKARREAAAQEAMARKMAESEAQSAEALQRGQPQVSRTGTLFGGQGFWGTPRTVVGDRGQVGSEIGIPENPMNVPTSFGLGKGLQPPAPTQPDYNTLGSLPDPVQEFLRSLYASRGY